jgi:hypothetical protein
MAVAAFEGGRVRARVTALIVDQHAIVDSDCETLRTLRSAAGATDTLAHSRWIEILGRESVSRRFFRELERLVGLMSSSLHPLPHAEDASELALLYASRLIFLCFLETKGWLNGDRGFLANSFADCMLRGGGFHSRVLRPLFFGTLNTRPTRRSPRARDFGRIPFLNGGLFARTAVETRWSGSLFTDEAIGDLLGDLLTRFRFTAREDALTWTETAIDPEMLGKAFESLMSSRERKTSGAFYTPQNLVRDVTRGAISHTLHRMGRRDIDQIRVLDPACGSGAFLVHALEELAAIRASCGDSRPSHVIRRDVLTRSIFGVDINPVAVWLCELRLWLSMAIDDPETDPLRVTPLPNLDRNVRVGDSLLGGSFADGIARIESASMAKVRSRYTRATGARKKALARILDAMERKRAIACAERSLASQVHDRRELLISARSRDLFGNRELSRDVRVKLEMIRAGIRDTRIALKSLQAGGALPFSFATHFSEAAARGGFDIVIGNPPWIRSHNLSRATREVLKQRFVVYRSGGWESGSQAAGAGKGFASQIDASAVFVEQGIALVRDKGMVSMIVPSKLWSSLAGAGVRELLLEKTSLLELHDLTSARQEFDAAVYPSVFIARKMPRATRTAECIAVHAHSRIDVKRFSIPRDSLPFDASAGSPWVIVPSPVRAAFNLLRENGIPLAESPFGRPLLGVKTGCNAAYLVSREEAYDAGIERELLRNVVRGDSIRRNRVDKWSQLILYPHNDEGPLATLPPGAEMWLRRWRSDLERRTDLHASDKWWRLFRTESAGCDKHRVVWADIGRATRLAILSKGDAAVPLNTCYVVPANTADDARALAALLSSPLANAWLRIVAEPVRGGYRRFFGWTMALFPVPRDWRRARGMLAPLFSEHVTEAELGDAAIAAYGLRDCDVASLIEWES